MKKFLTVLLISWFVLAVPNNAQAVLLIDTGEPAEQGGGSILFDLQWLAAQFAIDQNYTITSALGWMSSTSEPQTLHFTIYGKDSSSTLPDVNNIYYSGGFSTSGVDGLGWEGMTGLSIDLIPGTYWASFEVQDGDSYDDGYMPHDAPSPVEYYARSTNEDFIDNGVVIEEAGWYSYINNPGFGFRIEADVAGPGNTVPEPTTMMLLGTGLAGLAIRRRKA